MWAAGRAGDAQHYNANPIRCKPTPGINRRPRQRLILDLSAGPPIGPLPFNLRGEPAVDDQHLAGDIPRQIRGEE